MRLPSIFGRSASARERPSGLRNVRRVGRTQHLGFRKQLRTFMCFTTEEKLSQGASGDKRKRKRGSLSQRLRLTESSEDQSCSLDVMTQLVLRTSTGTPPPLSTVTDADPIDAPTTQLRRGAALSPVPADSVEASVYHEPSSLTLTSLDEDQLNAYLKVMFERCRTEPEERIAAEGDPGQFDGVEQTASADQQPDGNEALKRPIVIEEKNAQSCPGITTGESKRCSRKPILRAQCEELIRRHEELFGPIVIGEPTPASDAVASATATGSERRPPSLSHCLRQPRSELAGCEPCLPLVPLGAHLSIPQDRGQGPEWAEWRHHFSSGPDGVWRIVPPAQEAPEEAEAVADAAPLPADADARPKRLLGSLRDRCKALFRHDEKSEKACDGFGDALPMSANAHGRDLGSGTKPRSELVISEAKAQEILMEMKDEAIELCTSHHQMCPLVQTSCDPETYNSHSFRHWKRFFRPRSREWPSTGTSRDPKAVTSGSVEIPRAYVERLAADLASRGLPARDRLPVTGWWGTSPLLEAVLQVVPAATDGARIAATLACLRALSRRVRDTGLSGLVACLGGDPAVRRPEDRQAAWLTRPELPQLFAAAGFRPGRDDALGAALAGRAGGAVRAVLGVDRGGRCAPHAVGGDGGALCGGGAAVVAEGWMCCGARSGDCEE
ncbi:uncharacterized protein LOC119099259 [Pollicipes pollicipes]|uniref:uncharacterized protein LOC119099259 n=1 Tax=Pollicipes pollicipes TaxID=41117 RepID=UPI001884BED4|nr:uncharacterized protein LOC119099259 [Pollicipes pollicipes]